MPQIALELTNGTTIVIESTLENVRQVIENDAAVPGTIQSTGDDVVVNGREIVVATRAGD